MRNLLLMSILLTVSCIVSGCNDKSVKQIKADYFDIGFGQSLYEGYSKVDEETVQSLVKAYNAIEISGQTNQPINYDQAITITFIHNDQISGAIVLDDKGVFQLHDSIENYQMETINNLYAQAMEIYKDLKSKY